MKCKKMFEMLFVTLISMNLFVVTTNGIQEQILLKKDSKAPYAGVLVPEIYYKEMTADIDLKYRFQQDLMDCHTDLSKVVNNAEDESKWWLVGGMILGGLVTYAVRK